MRIVCVLTVCLGALAYAGLDGNAFALTPVSPADVQFTGSITVTVIETWDPGVQILGLDWFNCIDGYIAMASAEDDKIYRWDATNEMPAGSIDLMDTNASCFGVAAGPTGAIFTSNDWSLTNLFVCGSDPSWIDLPANPAGSGGRGMEYDEETGEYWEVGTVGTNYTLYSFVPGVGESSFELTQPSDQLSGVALFPYEGNLGVAVTCYNVHYLYFYEYDGAALTHIGIAPCPELGQAYSFGLCYANSRDTFYWSWSDGSDSHLTELDIDFDAGLTPSTWGSIKAQF